MGKNFQSPVIVTERNTLASLEAEANCVGLMLKDRNTIPTILGIAAVDDFYYEENKKIIKVIVDLYEQSKHIDYITVGDELGRRGELEAIGGNVQLNTLHDLALSEDKAEEYAKIVRDWAALRNVKEACQNKISEINTGVVSNPIELIDGLTKDLHDTGSRLTTGGFVSVNEIHDEIYDNLEKARKNPGNTLGITTGIAHLDNITGGLQKGDYIVLAARTSVGKTAFALQLAAHCALHEKQTAAVFSLEMSKQQLMYRMLSGETGISAHDMRKGELSLPQWDRIQESLINLRKSKLFIDDTPETTVLEIKAKLKKLIHKEGSLGLVVVDYINIVRSSGKFDNTYSAMGEISRDFKALAREIDVPLLVLAQLNRNTEGRADKMPSMSDIADSDKIPRDADLVMLLYRNSYYEKKSVYVQNQSSQGSTANMQASVSNAYSGADSKDNSAILLLDKHRNGPTGQVPLLFDEKTTKFRSGSDYRGK